MAKTRAEIVAQAMFELEEAGAGQPISAEDAAVFNLDDVAAYLRAIRIADLTSDVSADTISEEWFFPLSKFAAAKYAKGFGFSLEAQIAMEAVALDALRIIADRIRPVLRMRFERMTY